MKKRAFELLTRQELRVGHRYRCEGHRRDRRCNLRSDVSVDTRLPRSRRTNLHQGKSSGQGCWRSCSCDEPKYVQQSNYLGPRKKLWYTLQPPIYYILKCSEHGYCSRERSDRNAPIGVRWDSASDVLLEENSVCIPDGQVDEAPTRSVNMAGQTVKGQPL